MKQQVKKQHLVEEAFDDNKSYSSTKIEPSAKPDTITIKIKRSDNKMIKLQVNVTKDTVKALKEKVFQKELEENKNIRLIYQGKILQDANFLSAFSKSLIIDIYSYLIDLSEGAFIHAFITEQPIKRDTDNDGLTGQSMMNDPEERIGFDRLLQQNAYSEIEVHAIRLHFHSILMRCGIEKTNETSDSLLENEEKWLNKRLQISPNQPMNMALEELRKLPSVLSQRNDLVLPRYHKLPQMIEREGSMIDVIKGLVIGFVVTIFFLLFYLLWISNTNGQQITKQMKHGLYFGAFINFLTIYSYLIISDQ